jgi:hypothetical protein
MLVVEPGEDHTFLSSSEGYLHFVVQAPFLRGDKVDLAPEGDALSERADLRCRRREIALLEASRRRPRLRRPQYLAQ